MDVFYWIMYSNTTVCNIQLLPSYEVNIENYPPEGCCFPGDFIPRENNFSGVDNLVITSYEGDNCLSLTKLLKGI